MREKNDIFVSAMKRVCKLISDYMGVLVLLSAVAALVFPDTLSHLKPKLINPLLGVIMFGMGLTLKTEDFRVVFSRPKDVIVGCLAQFTVMPLLAFALTRIFKLDEALAIGVILVQRHFIPCQGRLGSLGRNDGRVDLTGAGADSPAGMVTGR